MINIFITVFVLILIFEFIIRFIVNIIKKDFQWLVTKKDEFPEFKNKNINNFFRKSYNKKCGWLKKTLVIGYEKLKYRRYEWKCDSLNERSCKAAKRFGFTFEGVFRQMLVVKGRNRDTAWFSIIDKEWKKLKKGYLRFLKPSNFDKNYKQLKKLKF